MTDSSKTPSIRIDWFDGSVVEDEKPSTSQCNEEPEPEKIKKAEQMREKKPIGFARLLDLSVMEFNLLNLEVSQRPGFWHLFDQEELKGDFIVLIVKILATLYKGIVPDESFKIVKLLETRFLCSDFLEKLTNYLETLPNVRIIEKRMNMQLWNDVEAFFICVKNLCDRCIQLYCGAENKDLNMRIDTLLKALQISVAGVAKSHSERISNDLYDHINVLMAKIESLNELALIEKSSESNIDGPIHPTPHSNSFQLMNIYPSKDDLITHDILNTLPHSITTPGDVLINKIATVKPNIHYGAHSSVKEYLDLQFKLLREDCFGPLREGISKYLQNPNNRRHENIRVHPKVRVLGTYVSNNKVGHLVDIAWEQRSSGKSFKRKQYNKQLMFGSLLLFTSNNFQTILCATVMDSSMKLLTEGYLAVSFQNPVSRNILSEKFVMIESEVYFEPYHRVLKVLQNLRLDKLPMEKYIVDVLPDVCPPAYLTSETMYTIEGPERSEIAFSVLDTTNWPKEQLALDDSQFEAYQFALTREFAVIQGPPGTGKTFLGIKIASTILKNLSLEGTPMLVICYTNHALDQFLEGILNVTDSVIRLGSQSKSKKLEAYNLNTVRAKIKCMYSYLYPTKRAELEKIYMEITDLQTEIEKCDDGILCYEYVKPYLKIGKKSYELKSSDEDRVLNWLFEHLNKPDTSKKDVEESSWENSVEKCVREGKIETCFTKKWAQNEVDTIEKLIKNATVREFVKTAQDFEKLQSKMTKVDERLICFKRYVESYENNNKKYKLDHVEDLYSLGTGQRWQLYLDAAKEKKNELLVQMDVLLEKHNATSKELEEISTLIDSEVLRTARVVGVTTTVAARRHQLIKKIKSPIVIVEECADVLEAHLVASLTFECLHLILLGDHKQLRPSASNYQLIKDYHIDISLFERMINNGIHARTLTIQRRMRPNFAKLLVPEIYKKLESHDSVFLYPDVKGMRDNLYFLDHGVLEDSEHLGINDDSWSHQNTYEAQWCIALTLYLRSMGYTAEDITILATYNGQVSLIKKLSQNVESLRDVKITSVDNFQGEESRIVILSLVRSNRDCKIGFLSATNRVCVALSRAKEGFYVFGNITMLSLSNLLWMSIWHKLVEQGAVGSKLYIQMPDVEDTITIQTPEKLNSFIKQ